MTIAIHLLALRDHEDYEYLCSALSAEIRLTDGPDVPTDCEILVAGRPTREQLLASPRLRALIIPFAGLPDATRSLLLEFPQIAVHNIHYNALPVAEMAITLLLAAAKFIVPIDRTFRTHDWTARYQPNPTLFVDGRTVLILGYGAIGQQVARLCRGLGMRVLMTRRHVSEEAMAASEEQGIYPATRLRQLLPSADALILCVPATPETIGLIGASELALLPGHAILVNVSRGEVVDEAALYQALRDGTLYAAGLDVWYNYPANPTASMKLAPSAYPFHELENVVMSPHRASHGVGANRLRMTHLASLLNAAAGGNEMPGRIDVQAGY